MPSTRREFPLSDKIKQLLNITGMYVKGKVLYLEKARSKPITCLYTGELVTTSNALKEALVKTGAS
jgi:hypothetical protein